VLFKNRVHAAELLANLLTKYQNDAEAIVIGLPRGGVILAYEIAKKLGLPLDIICARKISIPHYTEFAIGAITETGDCYLDQDTINRLNISQDYLQGEIEKQSQEAARRLALYKKGQPLLELKNKTTILIDDGIATGATLKAAILAVKAKKAKKIVVATPVASPDTLKEIRAEVDEVICLVAPLFFQAVGQFYEDFSQTSDEEVIALLRDCL
jgi:putative phosphoribosyl transferase